jgi:hypothetical protein
MAKPIFAEIDAGGVPRRLFEITQTPATLSLILRSRIQWAPMGGASVATIQQHKYSVHASPNSRNNINIIKRFMRLSNNQKTDSVLKTRSLKQTNSFTPLFFELCSHLVKPQYDNSSWTGARASLGSYDPDRKTLIYGAFVGPYDRSFIAVNDDTVQPHEIICGEAYRLVVLSSFLSEASVDAGIINHTSSDPARSYVETPNTPPPSTSEFFYGMQETQCVAIYKFVRDIFRTAFFDGMQKSGMPAELVKPMLARSYYTITGS